MEVELTGLRMHAASGEDDSDADGRGSQQDDDHPDDEPQQRQQPSRGSASREPTSVAAASASVSPSASALMLAVQELESKLEDRDATIAALVKSSVAIEQQLANARIETEALRSKMRSEAGDPETGGAVGLDVIVAESASMGRVAELENQVEALQANEKTWTQGLDRAQKELQETRHEVAQLRSRLEATRSENLLLKSQVDQSAAAVDTHSDGGASMANSSVISSTLHAQIHERDIAIATMVQQSIEQDRLVSDLRARITELEQQQGGASFQTDVPATRSHEHMSWDEIQELRRETEMFASQVIEQDEEIEALTLALKAKDQQLSGQELEIESLRKSQPKASQGAQIARLAGEGTISLDMLQDSPLSAPYSVLFRSAVLFSRRAHGGQQRATGRGPDAPTKG
jgi:chromosome segregation ATPase